MACEVTTLLSGKDNVELVRNQIAAILAEELANQWTLAQAAVGVENPRQYRVGVYLENENPLALMDEADDKFPLVNVCLLEESDTTKSTQTETRQRIATFALDCYATSTFGEQSSVTAAWACARLVRNIIEAANYTYLKLRGIVGGRKVEKIETLMPGEMQASFRVCLVRLTLSVNLEETSPQVSGEIIGEKHFAISDENGQVIVEF